MIGVIERISSTEGVDKRDLRLLFNRFPEFFAEVPKIYVAIRFSQNSELDFLVKWLNSPTSSGQPRELVVEDCCVYDINAFLALIKQVSHFFRILVNL